MEEINIQEVINTLANSYTKIWNDNFSNFPILRFGKRYITPSNIEQAYYCEQGLHFSYDPNTKKIIEDILNKPVNMQSLTDQQIIENLESTKEREDIGVTGHNSIPALINETKDVRIIGIFSGIAINGILDVLNVRDNSILIIDRKFVEANRVPSDWTDEYGKFRNASARGHHLAQIRSYVYCVKYMLQNTKFDNIPISFSIDYMIKRTDILARSFLFQYNSNEIYKTVDELKFVVDYWYEKRNPIPCKAYGVEKFPLKRTSCVYRFYCNKCIRQ